MTISRRSLEHDGARRIGWLLVATLVAGMVGGFAKIGNAQTSGCGTAPNPVQCENALPGNPATEWDISGSGDPTIQGFATDTSVQAGSTIRFKIATDASAYSIDIFRIGYYQGKGARKVAAVAPSSALPQPQPPCITDATTGLYDCGNWQESASWPVPGDSTSGVYIARLVRADTGGASHIIFVVRNDASTSNIVFQTSDSTWQAYNNFGGRSLYPGPTGKATKVSYNRPYASRSGTPGGRDFFFGNEYPMVRWLEANGYDTTYSTDVDTDRFGSLITNHKVFLSVGHDEYWSGAQRANVEAARDAGVNLAFLSGNSVYWKTRWEPSADASASPYRTLVVYKETQANAKSDPSATWTGTWRDPRFSPPSDGGRPENALMGTIFKVNCCAVPLNVPEAEGKLRLWRGTSVASQAPGATATLGTQIVGYEWDEDIDNGFRPAGLIRLSDTTASVSEYLIDFGSTVTPGTGRHRLTMYRAASGALVFGAGTIQWSWGLDALHDGNSQPVVPEISQATVNLLADMGVQPSTLQPGLSLATKSIDTTAPTVTVTSPTAGSTIASGTTLTVTGTATDTGGRVAAVEVSTNSGGTWHPATGRDSWSYTYALAGGGSINILVRAIDDSLNMGTSVARPITVTCPCGIFGNLIPPTEASTDTAALELGVRFQSAANGTISGVRFYKGTGNAGVHTGSLWSNTGTQLATATFTNESATGWQSVTFSNPVSITAGTSYVASYYAPTGRYAAEEWAFLIRDTVSSPLTAPMSNASALNGVYRSGSGFPTFSFHAFNYFVDPIFQPAITDVTPPSVVSTVPVASAVGVSSGVVVRATFSEDVQPASVVFGLTGPSGVVAGVSSYDSPSRTVSFTPSAALVAGGSYSVSVSGAKDLVGNVMPAAVSWSFVVAAAGGGGGVSVWSDSVVPGLVATSDTASVELGVKFRSSLAGSVSAVRFYKGAGNAGPHTVSLWSLSGSLLGSGTSSGESAIGWQTVVLSSPVTVVAGTTYVASYVASVGRYPFDGNFFGASTTNGPLTLLASGTDGGNGVFAYGSGGFPTQTYGAANYWVDVVFTSAGGSDVTPPSVVSTVPVASAVGVSSGVVVRATFSEDVQPASVVFGLTGPSGVVAGVSSYDSPSRTVSFTPSAALVAGGSYSVSVSGAKDLVGNVMPAAVSWSFVVAAAGGGGGVSVWSDSVVPGLVATSDTASVELGVKFRSSLAGSVSAVRFYKGAGNAGPHTVSLWSLSGSLLGSGTSSGESAIGWQTVVLSSPVTVVAGTTYVASYVASVGRYPFDGNFFGASTTNGPLTLLASGTDGGNGVFAYGSGGFPTQTYAAANYWVDVVFTP